MKGINYLISLLVSVVVLIFLMRFFGVTWGDIEHFITHGIGGALKVFQMFKEALLHPAI